MARSDSGQRFKTELRLSPLAAAPVNQPEQRQLQWQSHPKQPLRHAVAGDNHPFRNSLHVRRKNRDEQRDQSPASGSSRESRKDPEPSEDFSGAAHQEQLSRPRQRRRHDGEINLWRKKMVRPADDKERREKKPRRHSAARFSVRLRMRTLRKQREADNGSDSCCDNRSQNRCACESPRGPRRGCRGCRRAPRRVGHYKDRAPQSS